MGRGRASERRAIGPEHTQPAPSRDSPASPQARTQLRRALLSSQAAYKSYTCIRNSRSTVTTSAKLASRVGPVGAAASQVGTRPPPKRLVLRIHFLLNSRFPADFLAEKQDGCRQDDSPEDGSPHEPDRRPQHNLRRFAGATIFAPELRRIHFSHRLRIRRRTGCQAEAWRRARLRLHRQVRASFNLF